MGGVTLGVVAMLAGFALLVEGEGYRFRGWAAMAVGLLVLVGTFAYFDVAFGRTIVPGTTARGVVWPRGTFEAARRDFERGGVEAFRARAEREKLVVRYFPKQKK